MTKDERAAYADGAKAAREGYLFSSNPHTGMGKDVRSLRVAWSRGHNDQRLKGIDTARAPRTMAA